DVLLREAGGAQDRCGIFAQQLLDFRVANDRQVALRLCAHRHAGKHEREGDDNREQPQRWRPPSQPVNPRAHPVRFSQAYRGQTRKAATPGQCNDDHVSNSRPPGTKGAEYGSSEAGFVMLETARRLIKPSARSGVPPFMVMDVMAAAARIEAAGGRVVHMEV